MVFSTISLPSQNKNIFSRIKATLLYEYPVGRSPPAYLFFKNRYFRAVIFCLMCLVNTSVYYGWQPYSKMLYRSGAYRWKCDQSSLHDIDSYCQPQRESVQALFQIALSSEFIFGVFAGICLDHLGPWLTSLFGSFSFFLGWICLIYSSQSYQMYIPGIILQAGAVNFIAFPCLCLGDLFPKFSGLAISLIVAAQTSSTAVAPIMKLVWDNHLHYSFSHIVWGFLGVAFFPLTFLYLLSVSWSRINIQSQEIPDDSPTSSANGTHTENPAEENFISESVTNLSNADLIESVEKQSNVNRMGLGVIEKAKSKVDLAPTVDTISLWRQMLSLDYILFTLFYILQLLQYGYYPTTVDVEYGAKISDFQGYVLPSQGIIGILFGLIVDRTKTLPICILLIFMMSGAYVTGLIRSTGLQYLTSCLYVISNSYIYTVKYTYVAEMYPPTHYGVLVGTMGCIAGAIGLINIPIVNADNYTATCIAYIVVGGVALFLVTLLWYRQKKGIHYKPDAQLTSSDPESV